MIFSTDHFFFVSVMYKYFKIDLPWASAKATSQCDFKIVFRSQTFSEYLSTLSINPKNHKSEFFPVMFSLIRNSSMKDLVSPCGDEWEKYFQNQGGWKSGRTLLACIASNIEIASQKFLALIGWEKSNRQAQSPKDWSSVST